MYCLFHGCCGFSILSMGYVLSCGDVEGVRRWRWTSLDNDQSLSGHPVMTNPTAGYGRVIMYDAESRVLLQLYLSYRMLRCNLKESVTRFR